jgi:hypothetical protein
MKNLTAKQTVAAIRALYPNPCAIADAPKKPDPKAMYCVGGAVTRFSGLQDNADFPQPGLIACALRRLNPRLETDEANFRAAAITHLNDRRYFEYAWEALETALGTGENLE